MRVGRLNLVDMAGSERQSKTEANVRLSPLSYRVFIQAKLWLIPTKLPVCPGKTFAFARVITVCLKKVWALSYP